MITVTGLLVGVLVNDVDRRFLNHTRRVASIAAERGFATRTCFCLFPYWHKHQAPDDAFHMWFHFNVDRDFHCWHCLCLPFMEFPASEEERSIDTLLAFVATFRFQFSNFSSVCFHTRTLFVYFSQFHSLDWLLYFHLIPSQFCGISRCFFSLSKFFLCFCSIKYRFGSLKRETL